MRRCIVSGLLMLIALLFLQPALAANIVPSCAQAASSAASANTICDDNQPGQDGQASDPAGMIAVIWAVLAPAAVILYRRKRLTRPWQVMGIAAGSSVVLVLFAKAIRYVLAIWSIKEGGDWTVDAVIALLPVLEFVLPLLAAMGALRYFARSDAARM